ncbi:unnamed protein product [Brachionus calyciflorus]|uniref:Uncharacterized protein n=1 Tax=Brachionus calyciflorus TaxID=104777 RepID=A0A814B9X9_9BILA|nr:unnamed protein product [Brachionus calyciflorus]
MKLPKFIKSSTHQERQQNLIKSNRQLMLTDNIFKIQPQKQSALFRDIINESKLNNNDDTTKTPCTPLYNFKSNKLNDSSINVNFSSAQANGRYVKMSQPKRLQRNRLHITKKPDCYEQPKKLNHISTPIKPSELIMNLNGRRLSTDELNKENYQSPKCTPLSNNVKKDPETPSSSNKFSLSKLTKFVSRSALKVINRKSLGSNSSSPESSVSSSNSSMQTDDELEDNSKIELFNSKIYTSLEQQKEIEAKINTMQKLTKPKQGSQPVMGVTSVLLKKMKQNTTGITCYPNTILVAMPIVFKSENLKENSSNEIVYDKLKREQVPFINETRSSKKMSKPIVKSLSSIQSVFESPKNAFFKVNSNSPILPSSNSCRISIYSTKSSAKLEKQLHYESFSEAVF